MGGKTTKSTNATTIPPEVLARYNSVNAQAQQAASTPFKQYSTDPNSFVAPLTATQNAGVAGTNAYANAAQPGYANATSTATGSYNAAQPYNAAATGYAVQGGQEVNAGALGADQINQFLSPYLQQVLGSTAAQQQQDNAAAQSGALGTAISSGAFGGDRAGIGAANLKRQQDLANAQIYSNIENQGFNTALGAAQQQQGVQLQAGQANRAATQSTADRLAGLGQQTFAQGQGQAGTLANLASGAQAAGLQGAQAQMQAGGVEQQTQQAGLQALYNQFLQQQSYPFQSLGWLANIAEGTGALSGNTTDTTKPGSIFSDERLKEDVRPIGKTNDGQTIYSYRYKGEPHTQIGLLAQEVEKHHPEAVGLAGGYKTVDYSKATADSERHHRAFGGGIDFGDGNQTGLGLNIPQGNTQHQMMEGRPVKDDGEGGSPLTGLAGTLSSGKEIGSDLQQGANFIRGMGHGYDAANAAANVGDLSSLAASNAAAITPAAAETVSAAAPAAMEAASADMIPEMAMMFLKRGGRVGRADGGSLPGSDDPSDDQDNLLSYDFSATPRQKPQPGLAPSTKVSPPKPTGLAPADAPDPDSIVEGIRKAEGTGKNPNSSARGSFQFTDPTFVSMFRQMFPERAKGMPEKAITALRDTPEGEKLSEAMGPVFTHQNMGKLQEAGHDVTPGNVYLAHFLGPQGALHILSASHDIPVENILPPKVIKANRSVLQGKKVGDVLSWASDRMSKMMRPKRADGGGLGAAVNVDENGKPIDPTAAVDVTPVIANMDKGKMGDVTPPQPLNVAAPPSASVDPSKAVTPSPGLKPPVDAAPKEPNNPGLIDNISKFAHDTILGTGNAALRAGEGLYNDKGSDDQYGVHHSSADWWIPLLTGIAGMGADRSGSLGGALAAGLGAGASAYQGQREFGQKQQKLNTERLGVTKDAQLAALGLSNKYVEANIVPLGMGAKLVNGDLKTFVNRATGELYNANEAQQAKNGAVSNVLDKFGANIPGYKPVLMSPGTYMPGAGGAPPAGAAPPAGSAPPAGAAPPAGSAPPSGVTPPAGSAPPAGATPPAAQSAAIDPHASAVEKAKGGHYSSSKYYGGVGGIDESDIAQDNDKLSVLGPMRAAMAAQGLPTADVDKRINDITAGAYQPATKSGRPFTGYQNYASKLESTKQQVAQNAAMKADRETQISAFEPVYQAASQSLAQLANVYQNNDLNAGSAAIGHAVGMLRSIPGVDAVLKGVPGWQSIQAGSDEAKKLTAQLAMATAQSSGLTGAPKAALDSALSAIADPGRDPSAKFRNISTAIGNLEREHDHLREYNGVKNNVDDVGSFDQDWNSEANHQAKNYELVGRRKIGGHFKGMTDAERAAYPIPEDLSNQNKKTDAAGNLWVKTNGTWVKQ